MAPHPDNKYIKALLNNDHLEIDKIYTQYFAIVTSYVRTNSGTEEQAKDLFQESLMALYRKAEEGFVLTCPLKPYFLGICRYKWLDQIKKDKKRFNKESDAFEVTNSKEIGLHNIKEEIEDYLDQEKDFLLYREHFNKLSPTCQEIIGLSLNRNEQTGKTNTLKDIAEILGLNYSYVRREKNNCFDRLIDAIKSDPRY